MKISHMFAAVGLAVAALGAGTAANAQNYYSDRGHSDYRDHDSRRYDRYDHHVRYDRYDHDRRSFGRHHRSYRYERCHTEWHHHHRVEVCR